MATIQSMVVRLGMNPDEFMKGADRAQKAIKTFRKEVNGTTKTIRGMTDAIGSLGRPTSLLTLATAGVLASKAIAPVTAGLIAMPAAAGVAAGALATVKTATGGLSEAMEALASGDIEKINEAMSELSPAGQELVRTLDGIRSSFGGVQKAVQQSMFAGMAAPIQSLANTYLPLLKDEMTGVAGAINTMMKQGLAAINTPLFRGAIRQMFDTTRVAIENLTPAIQPLIGALGNLIKAGAPLIEQFTKWLGTAAAAKLGFLASSEGLATMSTALHDGIAAFKTFIEVMGPVLSSVFSIIDVILILANQFNQLPMGVQTAIASFLLWGFAINGLISRFAPLFATLRKLFPLLTKLGIAVGKAALKFVVAFAKIGAAALKGAGKALLAFTRMMVRAAIWAASMMARAVVVAASWFIAMGPIGWIIAAVIGLVVLIIANWDKVKAFTISVFKAIWSFLKSVWNSIVTWITNAGRNVWTTVRDAFNRVNSIIRSLIGRAIGFVRSIPGKILGALGNLGSLLWDAGRSIIQGLIDGLMSAVGWLKDKLSWITGLIPDWKGPIQVDAKLLEPAGKAIMGGLQVGIDSETGNLKRQLQGVTDMISGGIRPNVQASPADMPAGVTADDIRDAMEGMAFTLDERSGRVMAKVVNKVNANQARR